MKRQHFGVRRLAEHGEQIHLAGFRQITPQSSALRGPRDFQTPGRSEFAREQGFCLRHKRLDAPKGAGPPCGPFGDLPGPLFQIWVLYHPNMENKSIWLVSAKSPHKAPLCGDPGISKLPGEINSPGSKVFASGKNAWTRQKARGRRAALSAICRGRCFKFGGSIIRTWKTNPSDWSPANRRRHPRPSEARCGFWRPWGRRRKIPRWR